MNREVIITADGSTTIKIKDWDEQYHSLHGAIAEANHVFIDSGLKHVVNTYGIADISILEMGFGTGLNAWLTALEAEGHSLHVKYTGIEAFPISKDEMSDLNFSETIGMGRQLFMDLHSCKWEEFCSITDYFSLKKRLLKIEDAKFNEEFDLIYFDAFGWRVQPELWTASIFEKMKTALTSKGVLVTYSAKGSVRRTLLDLGFLVEKLPGPPGKREMLRATKP